MLALYSSKNINKKYSFTHARERMHVHAYIHDIQTQIHALAIRSLLL